MTRSVRHEVLHVKRTQLKIGLLLYTGWRKKEITVLRRVGLTVEISIRSPPNLTQINVILFLTLPRNLFKAS